MTDRYDTSDLPEGQHQPGSDDQVLLNKLGIIDPAEIDRIEAEKLAVVMDRLIGEFDATHSFTVADLCYFHELWLSEIYEWAGQYRKTNLSKGGFPFCAANRIEPMMQAFEEKYLATYTPCQFQDRQAIVSALSIVHVEFELIHPFREGNGRLGRMLATLMALQAGLPLLDFSLIAEEKKQAYFAAIQMGLDEDYSQMENLFDEIIQRSLAASEKS